VRLLNITAKLLGPSGGTENMSARGQELIREAFAGALHSVFVVTLIVILVGAFTVLLMPRGSARELRDIAEGAMIEELHEHPEEATEYSLHF